MVLSELETGGGWYDSGLNLTGINSWFRVHRYHQVLSSFLVSNVGFPFHVSFPETRMCSIFSV